MKYLAHLHPHQDTHTHTNTHTHTADTHTHHSLEIVLHGSAAIFTIVASLSQNKVST